ncbi:MULTISPECIES: CGNR zinc finger domain-containing protein [unclassified Rhodococcus (in: high G+C Gram-positive bacteria)]|uniref:CGNR zinc finger domain-containing protein n=1 Tax=unclassified Rhodococcus (in: high G+C Gram-positive bacteria) TaxID=192944 RepID=UPI00163AA86A|nr:MULTISPECIES: CGNR zinc finger domain-containing protein [unclassified Rhodococcus (in: high G+C Gram-positive bacteria)]MBC2637914.1 CGNR zinc finger domain-containing protein [Rhodococcus sp. 3A]MBC2897338.1 CGNR zinc finger domain-containing protein [Rhodococcus sp. 4CII]
MTWPATDRYHLVRASGGLGFVQDLINTLPAGRPRGADLLEDLDAAQHWLDGALAQWVRESGIPQHPILLQGKDLEALRDLRMDVYAFVRSHDADPGTALTRSASLATRLAPDGTAILEPRGEGWRRVASIVMLEIFKAQQLDIWRRLKTCRNERCQTSFYDRSRNNSGVWHDARQCGNAVNLRASRARKRQVAEDSRELAR